jgi:hypothetical protein
VLVVRVHLTLANMFVGAKHDRIQYGIITNNLYPVMLRPLLKSEMHPVVRRLIVDFYSEIFNGDTPYGSFRLDF